MGPGGGGPFLVCGLRWRVFELFAKAAETRFSAPRSRSGRGRGRSKSEVVVFVGHCQCLGLVLPAAMGPCNMLMAKKVFPVIIVVHFL